MTKTKTSNAVALDDIDLVILAAGAAADDGALLPVPASVGSVPERTEAALQRLVAHGLACEVAVGPQMPYWREEGETRMGLQITQAGLALLGLGEGAAQEGEQAEHGDGAGNAAALVPVSKDTAPATVRAPARAGRQGQLLALLAQEGGATIDEMVCAFGWQPHSARAAITGLRKKGCAVHVERSTGVSRYSVTGGAA